MRSHVYNWLFAALAALGLAPALGAADDSIEALERQFRELPMEARTLTGPLFWLHGDDSKERLELYVGKVAEGGNGCFTAESRPHTDWLGEGWFRDLAICLEAAKKHGLRMWIFDEKWWPSGEVAGKVPERYGSKHMVAAATAVAGPRRFSAPGWGGANFIAAIAGKERDGAIDGSTLVDLAPFIKDGTLAWDAPEGAWKVMLFTWVARKSGSRYLVDGASRDCAEWYIKTVYQPHYDRFKDEFGNHIVGYFYDEPETHGDWGTEVLPMLKERGVDWKKALVAFKFALLPDEQAAARYQYRDAYAEAWGRTLYGGITRWCEEHKVKSIGHFLEHGNGYLHPDLCAGNMFQLMKYTSMGGIDAVFAQFRIGQRVANDAPCWQTPKLGSSISHVYGKPDDIAMVEIFGARGQDLTYPEMKWWTDHMQVSGINFMIPHSFNPRAPRDTDCPPYFYNGGFEPRWPLYRVYADYTSRLSVMLQGGHHVCPVALLFLGNSAHVGKYVTPEGMSEALQDALYDCDWLPYDVFEHDTKLEGGAIALRAEKYRVLIVPPVEVIPHDTLAKAKAFLDAGGVVVGYGFLPSKSATLGRTAGDIALLRDAIWGVAAPGLAACNKTAAGGRAYFLPEKPTAEQLRQVLAGDAGVRPTLEVIEGRTDNWLHVLHRVKAGCDIFFIANQNHQGEARTFRCRVTAEGEPELWDAMRNEITVPVYTRTGAAIELSLKMEPNASTLLVFRPTKRALPAFFEVAEARRTIPVTRLPVAPPPEPVLDLAPSNARTLEDCAWVWFPEGDAIGGVAPGTWHARKLVSLPAGRGIAKAVFVGTADNSFVLFVNGKETGTSDASDMGWRNPVEIDVTPFLRDGVNAIGIAATNGGTGPNPAGLIGKLSIAFTQGDPLVVRVDTSWKSARQKQDGWVEPGFKDDAWAPAKEIARFGAAPWGSLSGAQLTLSPVKADPFTGECQIPPNANLAAWRWCLELEGLAPEAAARVTVNGAYAGGFIDKPLRLDVSRHVKTGKNTIAIEPFAPKSARLTCYTK